VRPGIWYLVFGFVSKAGAVGGVATPSLFSQQIPDRESNWFRSGKRPQARGRFSILKMFFFFQPKLNTKYQILNTVPCN
jgi:hypothetical protein